MNKVKQVLLRAVALIDERGHHKGTNQDPETGAVCAYGAISLAAEGDAMKYGGKDSTDDMATRAAKRELFRMVGHDRVSEWNDEDERTPEEVKALLLNAAASVEEETEETNA